jgi:hypothetical protein
MIELMAVYQGCKLAHEGIRNAVEIYQQFKEDGKDVSQIIGEITGHLGRFFQHKEDLVAAEKEAKDTPKVNINVNEEAMNRVMRTRELQKMETELREMIIYQIGLPGLWEEFDKMRQVVQKERNELERQKKSLSNLLGEDGKLSSRNIVYEPLYAYQFLYGY